jgi:hypothetical protein
MDVISFIDDDFIIGDDFFLNLERIFEQDYSIAGVSGNIVADVRIRRVSHLRRGCDWRSNIAGEKHCLSYARSQAVMPMVATGL